MRAVSVLLVSVLALAACEADMQGGPSGTQAEGGGQSPSGPIELPGELDDLTVIDIRVGDGEQVEPGDTAVVHYTGWLYDPEAGDRRGEQFDSSRGGMPFEFQLGRGRVIEGWDEGVAGMRVGGRRYLFIPPEYGYGESGSGESIPPNAPLFFDVELVDVQ